GVVSSSGGAARSHHAANARPYAARSSGRRTNVACPAQYTASRVSTPTAASASANTRVDPTGTSRPARRRSRENPTAARSRVGASDSGTAFEGHVDDLFEAGVPRPLLVLAVLQDRSQREVDVMLVELRTAQRQQRLRPVDRLGDTGRLVEVQR